jgi:phage-related tail fiber protein
MRTGHAVPAQGERNVKVTRAIAAVALASAGTFVLAACAQEAQDAESQTLTVTVSDKDAVVFEVIDQGSKGFGPGDLLVEDAPVVDDAGEEIGRTLTTITVVSGDEMADFNGLIDCTVELAEGNLHFTGGFAMADLSAGATVPVVGGTGGYKSASGTVTMTMPDETKSILAFDFTVP